MTLTPTRDSSVCTTLAMPRTRLKVLTVRPPSTHARMRLMSWMRTADKRSFVIAGACGETILRFTGIGSYAANESVEGKDS